MTAATAPPKNPKAQAPLVDEPPHRAVTAAKRAVDPDHRSGPETAPRDLRPDPDRHQAGRASELPRNLKAEAALERLKEQVDHAQAKRAQQLEDEIKAMRELIAGRLEKDDRPVSEIMVDLIFDGPEGKVVLAESIGRNGVMSRSCVSPLAFVKLLHAYMLKSREETIKRREAKIKQERTGGGIRVVLLRATADPLVKPGSHDGGNVEVVGRSLAPATAKR